MYYAALCGMRDVAESLILGPLGRPQDVGALGFKNETPLHVASRCGYVDVAQLLLTVIEVRMSAPWMTINTRHYFGHRKMDMRKLLGSFSNAAQIRKPRTAKVALHYFWRRKVGMRKLLASFSNTAHIRKLGTTNTALRYYWRCKVDILKLSKFFSNVAQIWEPGTTKIVLHYF